MSIIVTQAKNGYLQEVIKLLHAGYSVEEQDSDNATALYWSACRGYPEICKVLLDFRSQVNTKVKWGSTPLHAAADRGQIDCIKILIYEGKADVNVQNDRGDTPLHLSCYRGFVDIVRILIDARANPFTKNKQKKTALQEAHSQNFHVITDILDKYQIEFERSKLSSIDRRNPLKSTNWHSHPPVEYTNNLGSSSTSNFSRNLRQHSLRESNYNISSQFMQEECCEGSDHMLPESMMTSSSDMLAFNQSGLREPTESEMNFSSGTSTEISKETVESFAEVLQIDLAICKDKIGSLEMDNDKLKIELKKAHQLLFEEQRARQELVRRSHMNKTELAKRVSEAETKSLTNGFKSSEKTELKLCHKNILDLIRSRNISFDWSKLCDNVQKLWQRLDYDFSLDVAGREWILNREYTVVGDIPVNHYGTGQRDGSCSLVFRIKHKEKFYMLKMMINLINLQFFDHNCGYSIDEYLVDSFGPEYLVPLLLSSGHPNIINILHYYQGSTASFKRFQSLLVPQNLDVPIEMANRTTFLVLPEYPTTLKTFMLEQKQAMETPLYGLSELFLLQFVYQLLSSIVFLQSKKIVHRDIKADNIFLDYYLRPVLGDFGLARCLNDRNGRPSRFVEKGQASAGNSHAWAPELCRYSRCSPELLPQTVLLEDIYSKSDGFAAARMIYSILQPEDAFPTSSPNVPHYENSKIPELPSELFPEFRTILRDLVLNDPVDRPTVKQAMFRVGGLLFSPNEQEVTSLQEMTQYQEARLLTLSAVDSETWYETRNT
ncbi:uncharacterized protein LOC126832001 [Patella vulgata]|uniref:uncharacterized protein LOC126832001 n=1 Tax=Patella vulgata TaxID=6465 RepID=UPI0024A9A78C|nr:uncharacterized protein LOC126832001 [Patella vulgata]